MHQRGIAKCNVATAYDTAVMAMTAAISAAPQWASYATWLPQVADQIAATSGGAFGIRGIMAQNLQNSAAYAEAGRPEDAAKSAEKARDLALAAGQKEIAEKNRELLELYRSGGAYHESE